MPDPADSPRLTGVAALREWARETYPGVALRRFFELELLDRSFGLAAQVFVALLPLVIVIVSVVLRSDGEVIATQMSDRFGLAGAAEAAVRALFTSTGGTVTISWLAVIVSALSAFSLSRRLSRVYASIFGLPSLKQTQLWRGIVWIALQIALYTAASQLRSFRRDSGMVLAIAAGAVLIAVWIAGDAAGMRLLVPTVPRYVLLPSAILSSVGRLGVGAWAAIYMPSALSSQAEQFGPIGVTFSLFTLFLVTVVVLLVAPLLVVVWYDWRGGRRTPVLSTVPAE